MFSYKLFLQVVVLKWILVEYFPPFCNLLKTGTTSSSPVANSVPIFCSHDENAEKHYLVNFMQIRPKMRTRCVARLLTKTRLWSFKIRQLLIYLMLDLISKISISLPYQDWSSFSLVWQNDRHTLPSENRGTFGHLSV